MSNEELTDDEIRVLTGLYKKYSFGSSMGFPLKEAALELNMDPTRLEEYMVQLRKKGIIEDLVLPISSNTVTTLINDALTLEFSLSSGAITNEDYQKRRADLSDWARTISKVEVIDSLKTWFQLPSLLTKRKASIERVGIACSSRQIRTDIAPEVYNAIMNELNNELLKIQSEISRVEDEVWKKVDELMNNISIMRSDQKIVATKYEMGVALKAEAEKQSSELEKKIIAARSLCNYLLKLVSVPLVSVTVENKELDELKKRETEIVQRLEQVSAEEEELENTISVLQESLGAKKKEMESYSAQTEQEKFDVKDRLNKLEEAVAKLDEERNKLVETRTSMEEGVRKGEESLISIEAEYFMGRVSEDKYSSMISDMRVRLQKAKENLESISSRVLQIEEELSARRFELEEVKLEVPTEQPPEVTPTPVVSEEEVKIKEAQARLEEVSNEAGSLNSELIKVRSRTDGIATELPKEVKTDIQAYIKAKEEDGISSDRLYDAKCMGKEVYDLLISNTRTNIVRAEKLRAQQTILFSR